MKRISEKIFETDIMKEVTKSLTEEEIEDLKAYTMHFMKPVEDIVANLSDKMSTETSKEELADDIDRLFTPEGMLEVEKWLEKN